MVTATNELRDRRRRATVELVVVAPLLLAGVVLTASLFGAYFGIPLLLVAVPLWIVAWRVRTDPGDDRRFRRLRVGASLLALGLAVVVGANLAYGFDDLDAPAEIIILFVALCWVAAAWWVAQPVGFIRRRRRSSPA